MSKERTNRVAEELNQKYAKELSKLNDLMIALSQQNDVVMDVHYKYVQAVNTPNNWKLG